MARRFQRGNDRDVHVPLVARSRCGHESAHHGTEARDAERKGSAREQGRRDPELPFSAVRGFYDPSVNFELEFDVKTDEPAAAPVEAPVKKVEAPAPVAARKTEVKKAEAEKAAPAADGKGAEVVSLDAFRKK